MAAVLVGRLHIVLGHTSIFPMYVAGFSNLEWTANQFYRTLPSSVRSKHCQSLCCQQCPGGLPL